MDRKESDPTRNPNSNELSLEERQRLIDKLNWLQEKYASLIAIDESKRTEDQNKRIGEILREIEEIERKLSSF